MLYKVVLTLASVGKILKCDHSNESYWAVLSCGAVCYAVQCGSNVWVCGWNPKVWWLKNWRKLFIITFVWKGWLFWTLQYKISSRAIVFFVVTLLNIFKSLIPIFQWPAIVNNQFKLTGLRQQNNHFLIWNCALDSRQVDSNVNIG